jgi:hypothetical protein
MDQVLFWVVTTIAGIALAALGFFLKKLLTDQKETNQQIRTDFTQAMQDMRADFQSSREIQDKRIEKLENRLQDALDGMPYKYTLRDDFIRAMSAVEVKLNKILDYVSFSTKKEG